MQALVVDDSRAMRTIIGRILKSLGFSVVEAGNGREALSCLGTAGAVSLAMVDWNMPEMNGLDFVKAVRADERYRELPVVMVTTESEVHKVEAALVAGASEYVMKPFTPEALREKLGVLGIGLEVSDAAR